MEFGILGPLAVWREGRDVELGAAKQRALLAVLLLHAGETLSTERLVDALWGEKPPATAVKALQVYISHLRKTLGEGVVETRPLGYVLELDEGALDLRRFERLLDQGRQLLDAGDAERAATTLREALGLWRGEPLADFRYEAFAANAIGRLDELRLIALEQRLEADLETGRHAEAVPELEALVREYPLREGLRGLLMRALYRSGRQADALAVMHDTRATLRDELGLDPGQPLQQLEKQILLQDPALDLPAAPKPPPAPARATVQELPPAAAVAARAQRKLVTVLFADVAGSTELGESLDPEALRALLGEYFERMRVAAERHGGVVEKFIGDAVMAVFGVPAVHEDDAIRALRAAMQMREAIVELGLEGRIGIESGEVVVGTPERLVTGRAVTTAARLEQAAQPGEILLGEGTMQLAREGVTVEPLDPLELKGKPKPVKVWRLLSVSAEPPERHFDSPFVGREQELSRLDQAWERVRTEVRCELVTVVGAAGVGKSRLVAEFLTDVDATIAHGRCLSYGAGITYWPVVEVLTHLRSRTPDVVPEISTPLLALLDDTGSASTDELAWAFRKFVEALSRERPFVLVFDDIQWGEEALLDLIEHVAFVSSGAPILLLCMARPELLDRRPGWRSVLRLEPLTPDEAEALIEARMGGQRPDAAVAKRIVEAAEGNPLFVQEMAVMLQESGDEQVAVPPTIQALLAARLDQLEADERTVLEAAAVEGEVFHRAAVQLLAPDEARLTTHLTTLVRKEFIRPDRPLLAGEDAFRFRHLLLREAAYDAIPKATRCGLHERYADWLDERSAGLDAFVGYHLEQAYRYRVELLDTGEEAHTIACRASEHLEGAAGAALNRSDFSAAVNLLERAARLPPVPDLRRARLMTELIATLMEAGRLDEAGTVLEETRALASGTEDDGTRARLRVERQVLAMHRATAGATKDAPRVIEEVIPILERAGDERGLCRARQLQASAAWWLGRVSDAVEAWEHAAGHARRAGMEHEWAVILVWIASATYSGATPVEPGIERCKKILREVQGHPACEVEVLRPLGALHAFANRFDTARSLFETRNTTLDELGRGLNYVGSITEASVEMMAGNFARAEKWLRRDYDRFGTIGESALRSTTAALLARALLGQGRLGEAERFTVVAEQLGEPDDLMTQIIWRGVRARVVADRGSTDDAERLARASVELAATTDWINLHADALLDLDAVLVAAGRMSETPPILHEAIRLYEQKGDVVDAERARARLDSLAAV